jgi:hypothetical protein
VQAPVLADVVALPVAVGFLGIEAGKRMSAVRMVVGGPGSTLTVTSIGASWSRACPELQLDLGLK